MELHDAIRELVDAHGSSVFEDASGFRGVLDDVLAEDQASTGDINLLVDAVRFDVLTPLTEMIDGGADPARAVEEAGARLSRERGGSDQGPSSWASAVLGYAVGKVPEAVVLRYRSQRAPSSYLPPPTTAPPAASPPWQPPTSAPPATSPSSPPGHGSAPQPAAWTSAPSGPSHAAYAPAAYASPTGAPRKSRTGVWIAAGLATVVVIAGAAIGIGVAVGGGDDDKKSTKGDPTPGVDVDPEAIDMRYTSLSTAMTKGASDCAEGEPRPGEAEVVECAVRYGALRLVTYEDKDTLADAREARLDYRAGTLTADNGTTALYEYDPKRGGGSGEGIVYWDSTSKLQSATITADSGVEIEDLVTSYQETSPRVAEPMSPAHPVLRDFINILLEVTGGTRRRRIFKDETEENKCESGEEGIIVNVGRYQTQAALHADRTYYEQQYAKATKQGGKGAWKLDGEDQGQYYGYLDDKGETAVVYWDWDKPECNCYGVAWNFDGKLKKLENWWKRPRP